MQNVKGILGHTTILLGWAGLLLAETSRFQGIQRPDGLASGFCIFSLLSQVHNWGIAAAPSAAAMAMVFLRRHLLHSLRAATPLPSATHHRARLLATSTSPAPFSLEEYLVTACGLDPDQARKTAKKAFDESFKTRKKAFEDLSWSRLNSASNPQAILALLSGVGLSRADIAAVVAADPLLLRSSPKNIGPRLLDLRDRLGLSTPQIVCFLLVGSRALRTCDVGPRLEFFISLYGSFEKLIHVMKRSNDRILQSDLERVIKPNVAFLCQCGLSVRDIAQLCSAKTWILTFSLECLKGSVQRAEELGVPRSSRMFWQAMSVVASNSNENIAARLKFLKSTLGCEVSTTVSKMPSIVGLSEEYLQRKIVFLINEVGLKPQYIVGKAVLFTLSLEKRIIPRHRVMKVLQEKGLLNGNMSFVSLATPGEEAFKMRFIDCHKDSLPWLADFYAAAGAGVVSSSL
jgi:mTERF domain-containing protein